MSLQSIIKHCKSSKKTKSSIAESVRAAANPIKKLTRLVSAALWVDKSRRMKVLGVSGADLGVFGYRV